MCELLHQINPMMEIKKKTGICLNKKKKKRGKKKMTLDSISGNQAGDAAKVVQLDFDSWANTLQLSLMLLLHSTRVFKDAAFASVTVTTTQRHV